LFQTAIFRKFQLPISASIYPAVRARWRFFLLIHVNLEALFVALHFPIRDGVAHAVEKRAAAQIDVPDQHAAEMADMTDVVTAEAESSQEFQRGHDDYKRAHTHLDGDGKHDDLAVRKKNRAGEQHPKNRARRANGRNVGGRLTPEEKHFYDNVDETGAHAGQKVILQKTIA